MKKTVALVLAAAAALAGPVLIQQRNDIEYRRGVANEPDEITYGRNCERGAVNLHVGLPDGGTVPVEDASAIHVTRMTTLADGEFAMTFSDASITADGGTVTVYDGDPASTAPDRTIVFEADGFRLARVDCTVAATNAVLSQEIDGGRVVLRCSPLRVPGPPVNATLKISGITVRAFAGAAAETLDLTTAGLTVVDSLGEVDAGGIRAWVKSEYDPQTAPQWSKFPARSDVRLDGRALRLNKPGNVKWTSDGDHGTNSVRLVVNGDTAMEIKPGLSTASAGWNIRGVETAGGVVTCYVDALYGEPPTVLAATSPDGVFAPVAGQVSSFPEHAPHIVTEGGARVSYDCYSVSFAEPDDEAVFFKAEFSVTDPPPTKIEFTPDVNFASGVIEVEGHRYHRETLTVLGPDSATITRSFLVEVQ